MPAMPLTISSCFSTAASVSTHVSKCTTDPQAAVVCRAAAHLFSLVLPRCLLQVTQYHSICHQLRVFFPGRSHFWKVPNKTFWFCSTSSSERQDFVTHMVDKGCFLGWMTPVMLKDFIQHNVMNCCTYMNERMSTCIKWLSIPVCRAVFNHFCWK